MVAPSLTIFFRRQRNRYRIWLKELDTESLVLHAEIVQLHSTSGCNYLLYRAFLGNAWFMWKLRTSKHLILHNIGSVVNRLTLRKPYQQTGSKFSHAFSCLQLIVPKCRSHDTASSWHAFHQLFEVILVPNLGHQLWVMTSQKTRRCPAATAATSLLLMPTFVANAAILGGMTSAYRRDALKKGCFPQDSWVWDGYKCHLSKHNANYISSHPGNCMWSSKSMVSSCQT